MALSLEFRGTLINNILYLSGANVTFCICINRGINRSIVFHCSKDAGHINFLSLGFCVTSVTKQSNRTNVSPDLKVK